ncbi:hypothetical protein RDABS01_024265 [Bienertia sinuspersici]
MGGPKIKYDYDTLWRTWELDNGFLNKNSFFMNDVQNMANVHYSSGLATKDDAPICLYGTCKRSNNRNHSDVSSNVAWSFDIDIGFQYLIRFHYCDIVSTSKYELFFNVFVNSWMCLDNGSLDTPIYVDFVTPDIRHNKLDISISPAIKHVNNPDGILNGLEIMKMSNLQHPLDEGIDLPSIKKSSTNEVTVIVSLISSVTVRDNTIITNVSSTGLCVPFTIVQMATNNFYESLAIGTGGFGKVYRGFLADGTKVAVKRGHTQSQHGQTLFQTEIEMLSQFRNRHLVSLIGYCDENSENILIYEYMENGTLKAFLWL